MSGHSTEEEVMELSLDVDSDDLVLPSDLDDYDYDYDACTNTKQCRGPRSFRYCCESTR